MIQIPYPEWSCSARLLVDCVRPYIPGPVVALAWNLVYRDRKTKLHIHSHLTGLQGYRGLDRRGSGQSPVV